MEAQKKLPRHQADADFVPNHIALDRPWVRAHLDDYAEGDEEAMALAPVDWATLTEDPQY